MQYMGGKARIAKELSTVILERSPWRGLYLEPFVGGGNMAARMGSRFELAYYADFHEDLALMWAAVLDGWVPPAEVTEEQYRELKTQTPSALRGFAGFACSFGGKWFNGYARSRSVNFAEQQSRLIAVQAEGMRGRVDSKVLHSSFFDLEVPPERTIAYLDPPYADTTGYKVGAFDSARFWSQAEQWAREGVDVYVSEETAPAGWVHVWEKPVKRSLDVKNNSQSAVEKLYVLEGSK